MSKTIRRKSVIIPNYLIENESMEYQQIIKSRYYSDRHQPGAESGNTPKSYRKYLNHTRRSRERQKVDQINKGMDISFDPEKRDSGYDYW